MPQFVYGTRKGANLSVMLHWRGMRMKSKVYHGLNQDTI
nr:unnamed protein product [Callosobruchus analis]